MRELTKVIADVTSRTATAKELIDQLHVAAVDQARGMEQISRALGHMEQVTQRVAASAEERASASAELDGQSNGMSGIVENLQILVSGQR